MSEYQFSLEIDKELFAEKGDYAASIYEGS